MLAMRSSAAWHGRDSTRQEDDTPLHAFIQGLCLPAHVMGCTLWCPQSAKGDPWDTPGSSLNQEAGAGPAFLR